MKILSPLPLGVDSSSLSFTLASIFFKPQALSSLLFFTLLQALIHFLSTSQNILWSERMENLIFS